MSKVGVIGCGQMGKGMVKNLLRHDHEVYVFDPNPEALKIVEAYGAVAMENVRDVAKNVTYVLTSLPNSRILEETLYGESGAFEAMQSGTFILDMSTTDVESTKNVYESARRNGIDFFDCPVSGGPAGSSEGTLTIFVGGDPDRFRMIGPILQSIGKEIHYIGESGSGQVVKLCNNMIVAGITVLLSEILLTGSKAGVSNKKIAEMMQLGSGQNKVLSIFGPNLLEQSFDKTLFLLNHMSKDIDLYMKLAKQGGVPSFTSSIVTQMYDIAKAQGKGHLDSTAVAQVVEGLCGAGVKV